MKGIVFCALFTERSFSVESFYVVMLVFLALLAAFDLFVGVSNDAVNFLSPAIGSRVAPFKIIMLVASVGVLAGATFSSGMMEIARKGVFYPQMFQFSDLMIVFFAVMITDVLLLDAFNSLGLPTSTTVSMVFELLGGAVCAAFYSIYSHGEALADIGRYINSGKALTIISGILISVAVAFIAGVIVQYLCRLIFTFNYAAMYRRVGSVFGGVSITAIFYFLIMKGAKGSSFMDPGFIKWIDANTWPILAVTFCVLTVIFHVCIRAFKVNLFKLIHRLSAPRRRHHDPDTVVLEEGPPCCPDHGQSVREHQPGRTVLFHAARTGHRARRPCRGGDTPADHARQRAFLHRKPHEETRPSARQRRPRAPLR